MKYIVQPWQGGVRLVIRFEDQELERMPHTLPLYWDPELGAWTLPARAEYRDTLIAALKAAPAVALREHRRARRRYLWLVRLLEHCGPRMSRRKRRRLRTAAAAYGEV